MSDSKKPDMTAIIAGASKVTLKDSQTKGGDAISDRNKILFAVKNKKAVKLDKTQTKGGSAISSRNKLLFSVKKKDAVALEKAQTKGGDAISDRTRLMAAISSKTPTKLDDAAERLKRAEDANRRAVRKAFLAARADGKDSKA